MEHFIVFIVSVGLFLSNACGNVTVEEKTNLTRFGTLEDLEVPDSALIFLERLKSKRLAEFSLRSRQSPEVQNTTSNSEEEDDEPSRRCTCSFGICKCCTGYVLDLFNQKACMKITYHPGDFAFDVAMSMNDRVLYENSMSGKNPKPICINPPRLKNLKVCAKFYNVFFPGRNFHFCLAMTGQWRNFELFDMAFDCLRMGAQGLAMVKPEENGGLPIPNPGGGVDAVVDAGDDDIEEYDENNVKSLFDLFDDDDRKYSIIEANENWKTFFSNDVMDVTDFSVYYDLETNKTITRMMPRPWYKPGWMLRLPFTGGPCSCKELRCTCCTGIRIQSLNFDRKTCAVLAFDPSDSMIHMDVQMNNATVYKTSFSAANAPPFCVPIPIPYLPPGLVDMCIRLFDITLIDQGLHVCMDMDTRIDKAPVLILHFDCMDMGLKGVMLSKPGSATTPKPSVASEAANSTAEPEQIDSDVFDTVTESSSTTEAPIINFVKYI